MKRLFAAVFAMACVVGISTPGFARGPASGITPGTGPGFARGSAGLSRMPALQNRIPAPLPPPPQAPVINGPLSPTGLPPMGGARFP